MTAARDVTVEEPRTGRELAPIEGRFREITATRVSGDDALAAWNAYLELQRKILVTDPTRADADVVVIDGKLRKRKSAWRKVAIFFGISVEELSAKIGHRHDERTCAKLFAKRHELAFDLDREDCGCPVVFAKFSIRATDPRTGRTFDGIGIASVRERGFGPKQDHNLPALAWTRAANRAIADLIGGGEVSAEDPAGAVEDQAARGHVVPGLNADELARYEAAWKVAPQDRRDRVRELLESEGYASGEFRARGREHYEVVIAALEAADEAP